MRVREYSWGTVREACISPSTAHNRGVPNLTTNVGMSESRQIVQNGQARIGPAFHQASERPHQSHPAENEREPVVEGEHQIEGSLAPS
jgi:hypothetical protein